MNGEYKKEITYFLKCEGEIYKRYFIFLKKCRTLPQKNCFQIYTIFVYIKNSHFQGGIYSKFLVTELLCKNIYLQMPSLYLHSKCIIVDIINFARYHYRSVSISYVDRIGYNNHYTRLYDRQFAVKEKQLFAVERNKLQWPKEISWRF